MSMPVRHTQIWYEAVQAQCTRCRRYLMIYFLGIDIQPRATRRLMEYASRVCRHLSCEQAADILGISASTVMRWDRRVLP